MINGTTEEWEELFGDRKKFNASNVNFENHFHKDKKALAKQIDKGEYLTKHVAACGSCHGQDYNNPDSPLSGGRTVEDEKSYFKVPNITSDKETGIGDWTTPEIIRAMRKGRDRENNKLSAGMHLAYRWLSDKDARAIALYLQSLPPVKNEIYRIRSNSVSFSFGEDGLELFSRKDKFDGYVPELSKQNEVYYGKYLSSHVSNCYGCHTGNVKEPFGGSKDKGVGFLARFKEFFDINLENVSFGTLEDEY